MEAGNGFADLQPLKEVVGDARLVALGRPTQGNCEIFQLNHCLFEPCCDLELPEAHR